MAKLVSVAEETGLNLILSVTPKAGFLASRPKYRSPLHPPVAAAAVCSKVVILVLVVYCLLYSRLKPVLSGHSKRTPRIGFQNRPSLNAGKSIAECYDREHSAILSTSIKLPFLILSILSGPLRQVLL